MLKLLCQSSKEDDSEKFAAATVPLPPGCLHRISLFIFKQGKAKAEIVGFSAFKRLRCLWSEFMEIPWSLEYVCLKFINALPLQNHSQSCQCFTEPVQPGELPHYLSHKGSPLQHAKITYQHCIYLVSVFLALSTWVNCGWEPWEAGYY